MNKIDERLLNWHKGKHTQAANINNIPKQQDTISALTQLTNELIMPIEQVFGIVTITYGFTSSELCRYIQKHSPKGTATKLDQHASFELNTQQNRINLRDGAACDFIVNTYKHKMGLVVQYICDNLNYDKIYYYGEDRPIHASVSTQPAKHLQIMKKSDKGRRYPGKKAYGDQAVILAKEL